MHRVIGSFGVGKLEVTQLSDAAFERDLRIFFDGVDEAAWTAELGISRPQDPVPYGYSGFLVRGDGRTTLIDTGMGARKPEAGVQSCAELPLRLRDAGVAPEGVDVLLHSHLHLDHCGWDVTEEGAVSFPSAEVCVHQAELDFWMTPDPRAPERDVRFADAHVRPLMEAGLVRPFDGDARVTPSVTMIETPGHTPGHCVQLVQSDGESLILVGDAMHHPAHIAHLDWHSIYDEDRELARQARRRICELAIETNALLTGPHFPILTLGRIRRDGAGYAFEPVDAPPVRGGGGDCPAGGSPAD